MRTRRARTARLALAACTLGLGVVAIPGSGAARPCPGVSAPYPDSWVHIAAPAYAAGPGEVDDYALDPATTGHLVATNGVAISRTTDGGCTWQDSTLPDVTSVSAVDAQTGSVVRRSISFVRAAGYGGPMWAAGVLNVEVDSTPLTQPVVLASADGGTTFVAAAKGLPQTGQPIDLQPVAGSRVAFLLVRQTGVQPVYSLYATSDGGAGWTQVMTNLPAFNGFALGPGRGGYELWGWDDTTLYRAQAGAAAFSAVPGVSGRVRTVVPAAGQIDVFFADGVRRSVSFDDGSHWSSAAAPQGVLSAVAGPAPGLFAVSADLPNVVIDPPASLRLAPFDASPLEEPVTKLQLSWVSQPSGLVLYALSQRLTGLDRFVIPPDFVYHPPPPQLGPPATPRLRARIPYLTAPLLSPDLATITLQPHQHRLVPYNLLLPPAPTPLDVYFMTDSTGSMGTTINDLQNSIQELVNELVGLGLNIHMGVADFRDYPGAATPVQTSNYAYRRDRAIGPVDDAFSAALQAIQTGGGTNDGHDSALEATYQAVTGAGRAAMASPSGVENIPAGLGADFRPGAMKVVLLAADDYFRHPGELVGYPGPSLAVVEHALAAAGVHFVGLDVDTFNPATSPDGVRHDPGNDMRALAAASGSFAGPAGVDCNGDGYVDLNPGAPLVCDYDPAQTSDIASAFFGLLASLTDYKPVQVGVVGPADVAAAQGTSLFPHVNVKAQNSLRVPVSFRCDPPRFGRTTVVHVVASVLGQRVATLPVAVRCLAPPAPPAAPPVLALPALAAAVQAGPPVPPAQGNANPQPNPNPQTQTQAGAASQEDAVQQLVLAEESPPEQPELQMSALFVLSAGLVGACAAGYRLRWSRRTSYASSALSALSASSWRDRS